MRDLIEKEIIIRLYVIQRHIHRSETTEGSWENVDAVLAQCGPTASAVFMERAGHPPISPDISHNDKEPIVEEFMRRNSYRAVPIALDKIEDVEFCQGNLRLGGRMAMLTDRRKRLMDVDLWR